MAFTRRAKVCANFVPIARPPFTRIVGILRPPCCRLRFIPPFLSVLAADTITLAITFTFAFDTHTVVGTPRCDMTTKAGLSGEVCARFQCFTRVLSITVHVRDAPNAARPLPSIS
jgi:hypothetical protein